MTALLLLVLAGCGLADARTPAPPKPLTCQVLPGCVTLTGPGIPAHATACAQMAVCPG